MATPSAKALYILQKCAGYRSAQVFQKKSRRCFAGSIHSTAPYSSSVVAVIEQSIESELPPPAGNRVADV